MTDTSDKLRAALQEAYSGRGQLNKALETIHDLIVDVAADTPAKAASASVDLPLVATTAAKAGKSVVDSLAGAKVVLPAGNLTKQAGTTITKRGVIKDVQFNGNVMLRGDGISLVNCDVRGKLNDTGTGNKIQKTRVVAPGAEVCFYAYGVGALYEDMDVSGGNDGVRLGGKDNVWRRVYSHNPQRSDTVTAAHSDAFQTYDIVNGLMEDCVGIPYENGDPHNTCLMVGGYDTSLSCELTVRRFVCNGGNAAINVRGDANLKGKGLVLDTILFGPNSRYKAGKGWDVPGVHLVGPLLYAETLLPATWDKVMK